VQALAVPRRKEERINPVEQARHPLGERFDQDDGHDSATATSVEREHLVVPNRKPSALGGGQVAFLSHIARAY
jgi:hypothetical protein